MADTGKTGTLLKYCIKMNDFKKRKSVAGKINIAEELAKLKAFKSKYRRKMTVARLKTMKGFEHISDELAEQIIKQLEEYASIVLTQMNRLGLTVKLQDYEGFRDIQAICKRE